MTLSQLRNHEEYECDFAIIKCIYHLYGCNVELKNKELVSHERNCNYGYQNCLLCHEDHHVINE